MLTTIDLPSDYRITVMSPALYSVLCLTFNIEVSTSKKYAASLYGTEAVKELLGQHISTITRHEAGCFSQFLEKGSNCDLSLTYM